MKLNSLSWHRIVNPSLHVVVLGMTLNCLHRVIVLQHPSANDLQLLNRRRANVRIQLHHQLRCLVDFDHQISLAYVSLNLIYHFMDCFSSSGETPLAFSPIPIALVCLSAALCIVAKRYKHSGMGTFGPIGSLLTDMACLLPFGYTFKRRLFDPPVLRVRGDGESRLGPPIGSY